MSDILCSPCLLIIIEVKKSCLQCIEGGLHSKFKMSTPESIIESSHTNSTWNLIEPQFTSKSMGKTSDGVSVIKRQTYKIHRILPTPMAVSTPTISACTAKPLIVRQLQFYAGNDELVAVEDSIDVGNVLYIIFDSL